MINKIEITIRSQQITILIKGKCFTETMQETENKLKDRIEFSFFVLLKIEIQINFNIQSLFNSPIFLKEYTIRLNPNFGFTLLILFSLVTLHLLNSFLGSTSC
jgi:hypothetical protein